jgi:hypothetical protein
MMDPRYLHPSGQRAHGTLPPVQRLLLVQRNLSYNACFLPFIHFQIEAQSSLRFLRSLRLP